MSLPELQPPQVSEAGLGQRFALAVSHLSALSRELLEATPGYQLCSVSAAIRHFNVPLDIALASWVLWSPLQMRLELKALEQTRSC